MTYLDLRANDLRELPDALAELVALEKLDLRWNPLPRPPCWVGALEARGCRVLL
jgi:hypothetical protein